MKYRILSFILIPIICYLSYENSLSNDFVFDDHLAIINNKDTFPNEPISNLWKNDIWGKSLTSIESHRSFRPLLILVFKILRSFYGLHPKAFRIVSIVCHTVATWFVYELTQSITQSDVISMGSSILFASHPIHVESVAAVVNIAESIACIFYIMAYFLYSNNQIMNIRKSRLYSTTIIFLWIVCVCCGILTKETFLSLFLLLFADLCILLLSRWNDKQMDDLFSINNEMNQSIPSHPIDHRNPSKSISWLSLIIWWLWNFRVWFVLIVSSLMIYPIFRYLLIQGNISDFISLILKGQWQSMNLSSSYLSESLLIRNAENPFAFLRGKERVLSTMFLHFRYFYLLLWPAELSPEYAFDCIPKISELLDKRFLATIGLYLIMFILGTYSLYMITTKKSVVYNIPSTALCRILVWLIIPFLPASAIFLRLGTLLAERLLYIPSIGFCMLLSLILYYLSIRCIRFIEFMKWMKFPLSSIKDSEKENRTETPSSSSSSSSNRKEKCIPINRSSNSLFLISISIISALYIFRTRTYNRSWKDDTTLFINSLKVCPRSAKLNLQLAKLYLNRQEYITAEYHIRKAKEIDPSFCDVGYQEALLSFFYYQDIDKTIDAAIDNLSCIYSSKYSLELLMKLWQEQVTSYPNNYRILENHAEQAMKGQLITIAANKYITAIDIAWNLNQFTDAIRMSRKLEDLIPLLEVLLNNYALENQRMIMTTITTIAVRDKNSNRIHSINSLTDEEYLLQSLLCQVKYAIGKTRYLYQTVSGDKKNSKNSNKNMNIHREKGFNILLNISSIDCIIVNPIKRQLVSSIGLDAINMISTSMVSSYHNSTDLTSIEQLARFCENTAKVLFLIDSITNVIRPIRNDWNLKAVEMTIAALQLWYRLGKLYFYQNTHESYYLAKQKFINALGFYFDSENESTNICVNSLKTKQFLAIGNWSLSTWCMETMTLHSDSIAPIINQLPYYKILYWNIHSIAAQNGFLQNQEDLKEVMIKLQLLLSQTNVSPTLLDLATKQLEELSKYMQKL